MSNDPKQRALDNWYAREKARLVQIYRRQCKQHGSADVTRIGMAHMERLRDLEADYRQRKNHLHDCD